MVKVGDVCTVEITLLKPWRMQAWVFARALDCVDDGMNWHIGKVQVIGEDFQRDARNGRLYRIDTEQTQDAARELVNRQNGQLKAYTNLDAVRKAITSVMAESDT